MATNFPTTLDALTNPTSSNKLNDAGVLHADQHANANDAIEALQAKVGVNSSAVTTSLDYKVRNVPIGSAVTGLGTGVATFLATPSSANLAAALTDETGSTSVVFSASPTFTGAITATSATLARGYVAGTATTYTVLSTDTNISWSATATTTFTLPTATLGRELYIRNTTAFAINSASANVLPLTSTTAGTAILAATAGKFAKLVGNGTNWVVMMAN